MIRRLGKRDLAFVYTMISKEGWNDRRVDVERMRNFEPEGCFLAEMNGQPEGHVFSLAYGRLGWIGWLIVDEAYRRKGVGRALMGKAVDYLLDKGVETVKLDAAPQIADLYRKIGFVDEYGSLRLMGVSETTKPARDSTAEPARKEMISEVTRFDAGYFGAYRTRVLSTLFGENPDLSFISRSGPKVIGYITCRRAASGYKLGPWTCDPKRLHVAEELLAVCLSRIRRNSEVYVGVPSPNVEAVRILQKHGFKLYSESVRMCLGRKLKERPDGVFAIAGPMKG